MLLPIGPAFILAIIPSSCVINSSALLYLPPYSPLLSSTPPSSSSLLLGDRLAVDMIYLPVVWDPDYSTSMFSPFIFFTLFVVLGDRLAAEWSPAHYRSRTPLMSLSPRSCAPLLRSLGVILVSLHLDRLPYRAREPDLSLEPLRQLSDRRSVQHGWPYW